MGKKKKKEREKHKQQQKTNFLWTAEITCLKVVH